MRDWREAPFGNAAQATTVGLQCVLGVGSAREEATHPGYPEKVLAKSE